MVRTLINVILFILQYIVRVYYTGNVIYITKLPGEQYDDREPHEDGEDTCTPNGWPYACKRRGREWGVHKPIYSTCTFD